jgi:hypothetical protein
MEGVKYQGCWSEGHEDDSEAMASGHIALQDTCSQLKPFRILKPPHKRRKQSIASRSEGILMASDPAAK